MGHDETIVFATGIFEETMHTPGPSGIPYILWPGVAVGILAVFLDPWRKTIVNWVPSWCVSAYCIVCGLAFNWTWAYSWFSQRSALTSGPVLGRMALFVTMNAVMGLLAGFLHRERKWQLSAVYFALASGYLSWAFHR
jgi:hypothetical protein